MSILLEDTDIVRLSEAVLDASGEAPNLYGHPTTSVLAYLGDHPFLVAFELAVILAHRVGRGAQIDGYVYGVSDVVEEMRYVITAMDSPYTEAIGRQIVFYWPNVKVRST